MVSGAGHVLLSKRSGRSAAWIGIDITHLAISLIKTRLLELIRQEDRGDVQGPSANP